MKPLPEETLVLKLLDEIKHYNSNVEIPQYSMINFHNSSKSKGRAGPEYGIDINVTCIEKTILLPLLVHELVHFNGIMNHKPEFYDRCEEILNNVFNKTTKEVKNDINHNKE